jgi:hypothetical protein
MAQVDVTDLLRDPDFVDKMTVITRTPFVNARGENSFKECQVDSVGSVQPASGRTIEKLPEAFRVANVSSFWFRGEIVATAPHKYASIIVFKEKRYQVQLVYDWSNFGAGYTEGTCVAEVPS